MNEEFGGTWTRAKLLILNKYLRAFAQATKRAAPTVYFDLFAGSLHNKIPGTNESYEGSTGVALRCEPPLGRLLFWEIGKQADILTSELEAAFPGDKRYSVIKGDCNETIKEGLAGLAGHRGAPAFAFIDPKGLDVAWTTLESLSAWRKDQGGRKVELWILLPDPAIHRVLGLRGNRGRGVEERLSRMYGCPDWKTIYAMRDSDQLSPGDARAEYVNLYRWRIENVLGYKWTHALRLDNDWGSPIYTMIYATDDKTGNKIMSDVYKTASVRDIPELQSRALASREAKSAEVSGAMRLFEVDPQVKPKNYKPVQTWPPPDPLVDEPRFIDDTSVDAEFE
ncbi:MAG: three-Cys-motif partner protein TcmP [Acidimicrobiales bacterium]